MSNNFSIVPLHFNKTIMLSITCFCEYFNLSYTHRPCLDAKSLLWATKKNLHGYRLKQDQLDSFPLWQLTIHF